MEYPGLSTWTQCNHKDPSKTEEQKSKSQERDGMMEAEVEVMHFKDRQDCEPRDVGLL